MAIVLSLGACREDEQGRVPLYQKGVYLGKADTEISEQARGAARDRMRYLARTGGIGGGAVSDRAPNVRPPPQGRYQSTN